MSSDIMVSIKEECVELYDEFGTLYKRIGDVSRKIRRAYLDGRIEDAQKYEEELSELVSRADKLKTKLVMKCIGPSRSSKTLKEEMKNILKIGVKEITIEGIKSVAPWIAQFTIPIRIIGI